ncbi:sulfur oxidation c-type cytochrome SoxA [Polynucleobacter sp. MG-Unter2-18]|uniref:sulfur oxidation c-type cytochrome SoxA n=1 Tax=Polynucleobacter TaxID=44013 RepID=UPI00203F6D0A|nr:sulfur oxidation c-type cytochrome SoxA [Polynucleobacter sp. MG-Unter2-18]MBU3560215.1 sulfur oxidation c-type cytochrome SoxA [Polynucleobacter hallstattensis]QWD95225.1 sulfur oxidation c-type cytochrome SoxA [Polynucleobacter sp. MG-Unter2-18]
MNLFVFCLRVLPLLVILIGVDSSQALEAPKDTRQSSYYLMTPENRAMQDDSNLNPAVFWVMDGHSLWKEKAGIKNVSCASCHGDSGQKMTGVATQFPKMQKGKLQTLEGQINQCRTVRQEAPVLAYESKELLALTAFVATQSKGLPIAVQETSQNKKDLQQGRQFFNERMGQLNLSCAQCHQDRAGLKLGGSLIPQGHPTAYPIYRIEWQTMGSLQRRLRNCMSGVRAQQFEYGSQEMAQLELFLIWRARGMPLETPGVRP